jgi:putative addiction module component (TIGR02574 family)
MNTETYDDLFSAALSLSPSSKVMLAEHLLKSLDNENQEEIDKAWVEEAEKRIEEIEKGEIQTISKEQVFKELNLKRKS